MRRRTLLLTRLVLLTAITMSFELIGLPQPVTGPLVNLMLILTTLVTNVYGGIALGTITPLIALLRGQLPALLAPFVPFIIVGNILLVLFFALLYRGSNRPAWQNWKGWLGIIFAATAKFLWLFVSARFLLQALVAKSLPEKIIGLMTFPQLATALLGGGLALLFHGLLIKRRILSD